MPGTVRLFNTKFSVTLFRNLKSLTLYATNPRELANILDKLQMLKHLRFLSIENRDVYFVIDFEVEICKIIFELKWLKYVKLPGYHIVSDQISYIEHLDTCVESFDDIQLTFHQFPRLRRLDLRVHNIFVSRLSEICFSHTVQNLTRFTLKVLDRQVEFFQVKNILKYLSNLRQFSFLFCSQFGRGVKGSVTSWLINGHEWKQLLSSCLPTLKMFTLFVQIQVPVATINVNTMDTVLAKFSIDYYIKHKWHFACDHHLEWDS
ncbi:unnamed protein product, partial [Didymodactylos carnosus]